jgi:ribonucleoside-diphosphate reductase alpha chain
MSTTFAAIDPNVRPADLPMADLDDNARVILAKRYLRKGANGQVIESAEDMFWRVAATIAHVDASYGATDEQVEATAREYYRLMTSRLFEPNSPTLMNAGRPLGQLSACFVLPVEDTLTNGKDGIYDTLRSMAQVHQSGGGTGFSFSRLRPTDSQVRSTSGVASGPISFMTLYDDSTNVVKQGGTRRGANMGILRVDHPDIRAFIGCKADVTKITNFNISVAVTDRFMDAVKAGEKYDLVNPHTGENAGQEDARQIFDLIVNGAWSTGEPGIFFIDRANAYNPVPHLGAYEATNPCGEQPLLSYDVCNLGSVNVGLYVEDGAINWSRLGQDVHTSTRFLDAVIDANNYPLPEITDLAQRIRRIGLGIMGFADLLVRMGVPFGSDESLAVARELMAFIDDQSKVASEQLAAERGVFPEWEQSIWGPEATCARDARGQRVRPMRRLRNCNTTTVAPTGTISIFAGCSGGIEPLFAVAFMRNQAGALMPDVNRDFVRIAKEQGWYSGALMERIAQEGHIHFPEVPASVQATFVTAHDVTPEQHVRIQAAFQDHVDSAISKTCNFGKDATVADVRQIYELAFALGCKGVTVYRDGSRPMQVLSTGQTTNDTAVADAREQVNKLEGEVEALRKELAEARAAAQKHTKRTRPATLRGTTRRMTSPLGDLYVTVNEDEHGKPFEVFATLGKAGGAAMADVEGIGRLISLHLRSGGDLREIAQQMRGISCDRAVGFGPNKVLSVPDAIGQALLHHLAEKAGVQQELPVGDAHAAQPQDLAGSCPECGVEMVMGEGCRKCPFGCVSDCG